MEVEPWEALDLDDSDLPSLLRPCKQLRSVAASTSSAALESTSSVANAVSELSELNRHKNQQASTSRCRAIPGPAGAVQAAMLRKNLDRMNAVFSSNRDDSGEEFNGKAISTQDYVRRAVEDTAEFDNDFTRHPWVSALQFLGNENGVVHTTPISSMKNCINVGRVAQVVAVIKSCTPSCLGGLIVSLKDPTGTIGASIHHKVLSGTEFGRNLTTGAVLILKEVAVFAPIRSARYLNVTLKNLVKVFSQDGSSTTNLKVAYPLQYADPVQPLECHGNTKKSSMRCNVTSEETRNAENLKNTSTKNTADVLSTKDNAEESRGGNDDEIKSQPVISKASLPQWTEEQLDELFAGDENDDPFLF